MSSAEFKSNAGSYSVLSSDFDIPISSNKMSDAERKDLLKKRIDIAQSLFGILPSDITKEEAREERLKSI